MKQVVEGEDQAEMVETEVMLYVVETLHSAEMEVEVE